MTQPYTANELREALDQIAVNQREFERTKSMRGRCRITRQNEKLFARLGIFFPPLRRPRSRLLRWWWGA